MGKVAPTGGFDFLRSTPRLCVFVLINVFRLQGLNPVLSLLKNAKRLFGNGKEGG